MFDFIFKNLNEQDHDEIQDALKLAIEEMLDLWEDGLDKPKVNWSFERL